MTAPLTATTPATPRSLLFVPADSASKMDKAIHCQSDALILDLEDSVHENNKPQARELVSKFLANHPRTHSRAQRACQIFIRINALDSGLAELDLKAVLQAPKDCAPDGIVLPKANCVDDIEKLSHLLDAHDNSLKILAIVTETPQALLQMNSYVAKNNAQFMKRLMGMCWGAEDLSAALGAFDNKTITGGTPLIYELARALCLTTARAVNVLAIDQVFTDFKNPHGLEEECRAAAHEGFDGKLAIHPNQVEIINKCFSPNAAQIETATQIVAAFKAASKAGEAVNVISLDGKMLDKPHLTQALKTLSKIRSKIQK